MMHMRASESLSGIAIAGALFSLIDIACQQASEIWWGEIAEKEAVKNRAK